jgi:hypothetical protein
MWIGAEAQWFPEYGVDLGPALNPPPASIDALRGSGGLYSRVFARGVVVVNPGTQARTVAPHGEIEIMQPVGGGALNDAANTAGWRIRWHRVGSFTVPAHGGVVYRAAHPSHSLLRVR